MRAFQLFPAAPALPSVVPEYKRVLQQVGWLFAVYAAAQVLWPMIATSFNDTPLRDTKFSFPIVTLILGILLLQGSLRAASMARWFLVFGVAGAITHGVIQIFTSPIELSLAYLRFQPFATLQEFVFDAAMFLAQCWIVVQLGSASVAAAREMAGKQIRDMRVPSAAGVLLSLALSFYALGLMNGEGGARAKELAAEQVGPSYSLHVTSISTKSSLGERTTNAQVVAWNGYEVKNVKVAWSR
jgi:hypothetical protein